MSLEQFLAVAIFVVMFVFVVLDKIEKHYVTLTCGLLTLVLVFGVAMHSTEAIWETLNFKSIIQPGFWVGEAPESAGIDWATIIFLGGMMIMVEGMAKAGFFRWLCMKLAKMVNYKTIPLFITFMIMAALLSMFIDSITVILFLAAVTVELARLLEFNPVPMILSEIFCANLGGSATMCGDPPNIIIGSKLHYAFADFLMNTGVIAGICLIFIVFYFYFVFRRELTANAHTVDISKMPDPKEAITSVRGFVGSSVIFGIAVIMLVTHSMTHLSVAFIGTVVAIITIIFNYRHLRDIMSKVDYKILLFFTGLFIVVGGLEQTGVLSLIANAIKNLSGGNMKAMVAIIIWVSAIASAFVDNIPFAATMVPIIQSLAATSGVPLDVLAWTLSMGTDVGGAATPIGASANVVGTSVAAKNGYPIGWGKYCKTAAPAMILVITISMLIIFVRYC